MAKDREDNWDWRGPRRNSLPPWVLVAGFGSLGVVVLLAVLLATTVDVRLPAFLGPSPESIAEQANSYVRENVQRTITTDAVAEGFSDRMTLNVRVQLKNAGTRTVQKLSAAVEATLQPSGVKVEPQNVENVLEGLKLTPNGEHVFNVSFTGLKLGSGQQAERVDVVVSLLGAELEDL